MITDGDIRSVNMNKEPLVTVITVSFNAGKVIEKTILSVISQTYLNIEYIIIDGASTDATVDVIKKYEDKINCWISEPDKGIYNAMNKGLRIARGEWVNFMNAGDMFANEHVISNVFSINKNLENMKVLYGDVIIETVKRTFVEKVKKVDNLSYCMVFCHQSTFVSLNNKKEVYFDEEYKIAADFALFNKLFLKYGVSSFFYLPFPISIYDADGISSNALLLLSKELLLIRSFRKDIRWYADYLKYFLKKIVYNNKYGLAFVKWLRN